MIFFLILSPVPAASTVIFTGRRKHNKIILSFFFFFSCRIGTKTPTFFFQRKPETLCIQHIVLNYFRALGHEWLLSIKSNGVIPGNVNLLDFAHK